MIRNRADILDFGNIQFNHNGPYVFIEFKTPENFVLESFILKINDITGNEILNQSINSLKKNNRIDISEYPKGVYILMIISNGLSKSTKFIKL